MEQEALVIDTPDEPAESDVIVTTGGAGPL
jgi:hypothetical protein